MTLSTSAQAFISHRMRRSDAAIDAITDAFSFALEDFEKQHGRFPDFDILCFRGAFSTTTAVIEIYEDH